MFEGCAIRQIECTVRAGTLCLRYGSFFLSLAILSKSRIAVARLGDPSHGQLRGNRRDYLAMTKKHSLLFASNQVRHAYKYPVLSGTAAQECVHMVSKGLISAAGKRSFELHSTPEFSTFLEFQVIADSNPNCSYVGAEDLDSFPGVK